MRGLWLALLAVPARGHRGASVDTELEVADPTISWAVQGEFVEGDELITLHLDYDAPFAAPFELMVPHRARYAAFRPRFAVVAVGLPLPTPAEAAALPAPLPPGAGAYVALNDDREREPYFEGVLRHAYWTTGATAVRMPAGEVEVWIWSPDGEPGPFLLGFGVEENFTGKLE